MKFDKANNWLTLIANIGVIAGILFLAFEIRQNNELLAQQSRAVGIGQMFSTLERLIENPHLLELADSDVESLTPIQRRQRELMGIRTLAAWEYQWGEWQRGLIDDFEWQTKGYRHAFHTKRDVGTYARDSWQAYKEFRATPEFIEWMEANVINQ